MYSQEAHDRIVAEILALDGQGYSPKLWFTKARQNALDKIDQDYGIGGNPTLYAEVENAAINDFAEYLT